MPAPAPIAVPLPEPASVPPAGGWARWRGRRARGAQQPVAAAGAPVAGAALEERFPWPWQGVDFSPGYVAFLVYIFVSTSFLVNAGQVAMVAAIVAITMGGRERWRIPVPLGILLVFLALVGLTYRSTEFSAYVWRPYQDLVKIVTIALVGYAVLDTRPRLRFFIFFYLAVFAAFPVRGAVLNWFLYRAATQGRVAWNNTFGNPNDLAALLIFPLGLALAALYTERHKIVKLGAMAGVAVIPLIIFMTQSRGAILALGGGLMFYFLMQGKGRAKTIIGLVAIAGIVFVFAPKDVWTRMANLKNATEQGQLANAKDSHSAAQRYEIWRVAWAVTKAFPVTGVGWSSYPSAHAAFARRGGFDRIARGARDAHSTYLTLLGETGLIGFLIYMSMIFAIVSLALQAIARGASVVPGYAQQVKLVLVALGAFAMAAVFGTFQGMAFTYLHLITLLAMSKLTLDEARGVSTLGRGR